MMIDGRRLQQRLGIKDDGIIGRDTMRALFARFGAPPSRASELGMSANVHFRTYKIMDNGLRLAHIMAQLAHESGGFRYMEEIASGQAYEGRKDLGNTVQGDGMRFKGRGPIQLTGRANYRSYGQALGIDFENNPTIVAVPSIGLLAGCLFWDRNNLNQRADADDILGITRRINGGTNGIDGRRAKLKLAKELIL